jgi:hypothetical protein
MNLISNIKNPIAFTILALALIVSSVALPSGSSARSVMSYPVLKAGQDYKNAEIRIGDGLPSFDEMRVIYSGSVEKGRSWDGKEGQRICAKATNNPTGNLAGQPAFCASSYKGIGEGKPEKSEF